MPERITSGQLINAVSIILERTEHILSDPHVRMRFGTAKDRDLKWAIATLKQGREEQLNDLTPDLFGQPATTPR